ncbi:MAG: guanine deaminase [Parachlamydiaceae bacterium]|nr:guanine deaminase [Parachlamydiaceae bacterium]
MCSKRHLLIFFFSTIVCSIQSLSALEAYRGTIIHFLEDPTLNIKNSYEYLEDGLLIVDNGKVVSLGYAKDIISQVPEGTEIHEYDKNKLIIPGFIDTHIHFPQTGMIASYGEQLLEWLNKYTFPHEKRFFDKGYSKKIATIFTDELLRNGTTSALVFASHSKESVEALFEVAESRNMRIISGNALGDRNLPDYLIKPLDTAENETRELIKKWHGHGRLLYAITPRFAPTSTEAQLKMIGALLEEHPDVYMHTHLSECMDEVMWVKNLFPWSKNYLDVYNQFGLVRPRSVFAHSIHISDDEINLLADAKASVSFCPTSNFFLGSGLFKWRQCRNANLLIGIGTDVGAGTSFSMLHTLGAGYKVSQLQGDKMNPLEAFYHLTLGGARALYIDQLVGNFEVGKEADFVVLDMCPTPLMAFRFEECSELIDRLFLLMILGDDRNIFETYIFGKQQYKKAEA